MRRVDAPLAAGRVEWPGQPAQLAGRPFLRMTASQTLTPPGERPEPDLSGRRIGDYQLTGTDVQVVLYLAAHRAYPTAQVERWRLALEALRRDGTLARLRARHPELRMAP